MKARIVALLLPLTLIAAGAQAQNVLLPSGPTTVAKTVPQTTSTVPVETVTTTNSEESTDTTTPSTASSSTMNTMMVGGQSTAPMAYISIQQQQSMIAMEQQTLASLQASTADIQQNQATINSQIQSAGQTLTNQQKTLFTQAQAGTSQNGTQLAAQIQQSQQRLAILKSGPMPVSEFLKLYQ